MDAKSATRACASGPVKARPFSTCSAPGPGAVSWARSMTLAALPCRASTLALSGPFLHLLLPFFLFFSSFFLLFASCFPCFLSPSHDNTFITSWHPTVMVTLSETQRPPSPQPSIGSAGRRLERIRLRGSGQERRTVRGEACV